MATPSKDLYKSFKIFIGLTNFLDNPTPIKFGSLFINSIIDDGESNIILNMSDDSLTNVTGYSPVGRGDYGGVRVLLFDGSTYYKITAMNNNSKNYIELFATVYETMQQAGLDTSQTGISGGL